MTSNKTLKNTSLIQEETRTFFKKKMMLEIIPQHKQNKFERPSVLMKKTIWYTLEARRLVTCG